MDQDLNQGAGVPEEFLDDDPSKAEAEANAQASALADAMEMIKRLTAERDAALAKAAVSGPHGKPGTANESRASSKARWRIVIAEARSPQETQVVFVGVNGRGYTMKRNVPIDVPKEVVATLREAVEGVPVKKYDERGNESGVEFKESLRFPFQVLGQSKDEKGNDMPVATYLGPDSFLGRGE